MSSNPEKSEFIREVRFESEAPKSGFESEAPKSGLESEAPKSGFESEAPKSGFGSETRSPGLNPKRFHRQEIDYDVYSCNELETWWSTG